MCIAPFEEDPDDARPYFAEVKKLYDKYAEEQIERVDFKYLSTVSYTHLTADRGHDRGIRPPDRPVKDQKD